MAAQTANSQLTFQLPSMSYIDAKWEEPSLRAGTGSAPRRGSPFNRLMRAYRAWRLQQRTLNELSGMTDRELMDVGLARGDIARVFDDANNADLRTRGR
jgi:uncharacterized protein YjiS (DUF1127 family)